MEGLAEYMERMAACAGCLAVVLIIAAFLAGHFLWR